MQATTGSQTFTGSLTPANTEDWTRATVTFQAAASSATVTIIVPAGTGTLHVDSVQLEESEAPNRYNMLENSDFRYGTTGWLRNHTDENTIVTLSDEWGHPNTLSNQAFRFGVGGTVLLTT